MNREPDLRKIKGFQSNNEARATGNCQLNGIVELKGLA